MPSDNSATALPPPNHIGIVVEDLDKTIESLSSIWGLGPWVIVEDSPNKDDIRIGEPYRLKVAFAKLGPVVLELFQPLEGRSIWSQFLEAKGEGIHHIGFEVSNWDDMALKLQEQGGRMVAGAVFEGKRWGYFETKPGGIIVDFAEPGIHAWILKNLGL
jgi:methylmalonyl-CoA/ethylmalonyl-CoA epimerase